MAILSRDFYDRDTLTVARELLGRYVVRVLDGHFLAGRITETEAYIGRCDKACHAYGYRRTERTDPLFMEPGHAYIYLIYGIHNCLNFVTEPAGEPAAVLLRAVEPVCGEDIMYHLRYGEAPTSQYKRRNLTNGPGKVCKALSLTRAQNRTDLTGKLLFLCDSPSDFGISATLSPETEQIIAGPRIGVDYAEEAKDFLWNYRLVREV